MQFKWLMVDTMKQWIAKVEAATTRTTCNPPPTSFMLAHLIGHCWWLEHGAD